jgi:hypothetical protein
MANGIATFSPLVLARITGALYIMLLPLGIFSGFYVPASLFIAGDASATASNIMASEALFRINLLSWIVVFAIDIVLSVLLYVLLRPVSKTISLVAASIRLAYSAMQGVNLIILALPLLLLSGASYLAVFETTQLNALVLLSINAYDYAFNIAILFFGIHVFVIGYLVIKSGYIPKILGILFLFASLAYLFDTSARLLFSNYGEISIFLVIPIVIGEIAFPLWLLIKGVRIELWEQRASEAT